jgi:hypothetical protein
MGIRLAVQEGKQQEREKPRIRKEDVDEMRGAWTKEAEGGGRGKGEKEGEKMNDSGLKGNGGERDERGEESGVTGPETQSGDCRKEKVVLQQKGLSTREGELRTYGLRVTDGVLKSEKIQPTNQLLLLLQRQKHEEVEGLDGPMDGDRVLIMANGAYERNRIRDGRH